MNLVNPQLSVNHLHPGYWAGVIALGVDSISFNFNQWPGFKSGRRFGYWPEATAKQKKNRKVSHCFSLKTEAIFVPRDHEVQPEMEPIEYAYFMTVALCQ